MDKDPEIFAVDRVIGRRISLARDIEYLIFWKGYGLEDATWEKEEATTDCREAVEEFERRCDARRQEFLDLPQEDLLGSTYVDRFEDVGIASIVDEALEAFTNNISVFSEAGADTDVDEGDGQTTNGGAMAQSPGTPNKRRGRNSGKGYRRVLASTHGWNRAEQLDGVAYNALKATECAIKEVNGALSDPALGRYYLVTWSDGQVTWEKPAAFDDSLAVLERYELTRERLSRKKLCKQLQLIAVGQGPQADLQLAETADGHMKSCADSAFDGEYSLPQSSINSGDESASKPNNDEQPLANVLGIGGLSDLPLATIAAMRAADIKSVKAARSGRGSKAPIASSQPIDADSDSTLSRAKAESRDKEPALEASEPMEVEEVMTSGTISSKIPQKDPTLLVGMPDWSGDILSKSSIRSGKQIKHMVGVLRRSPNNVDARRRYLEHNILDLDSDGRYLALHFEQAAVILEPPNDKTVVVQAIPDPCSDRQEFMYWLTIKPSSFSVSAGLSDLEVERVEWLLTAWKASKPVVFNTIRRIRFMNAVAAFISAATATQPVREMCSSGASAGACGMVPYLIITPHSDISAWSASFRAVAPNVVVGELYGNEGTVEMLLKHLVFRGYGKGELSPALSCHVVIADFEAIKNDTVASLLRSAKVFWQSIITYDAFLKGESLRDCWDLVGRLRSRQYMLIGSSQPPQSVYDLFSLAHFLEPNRYSTEESLRDHFDLTDDPTREDIVRCAKMFALKQMVTNSRLHHYHQFPSEGKPGAHAASVLMDILVEALKSTSHPHLISNTGVSPNSDPEHRNILVESSAKLGLLDLLLPGLLEQRRRVVIFVQHLRTLDIIGEYLASSRIDHLRIDSSLRQSASQERADLFNTKHSPATVLISSTMLESYAPNPITADTVVFFDSSVDAGVDRVALGRVMGAGQSKFVWVLRLVARDTADEHMVCHQLRAKSGSPGDDGSESDLPDSWILSTDNMPVHVATGRPIEFHAMKPKPDTGAGVESPDLLKSKAIKRKASEAVAISSSVDAAVSGTDRRSKQLKLAPSTTTVQGDDGRDSAMSSGQEVVVCPQIQLPVSDPDLPLSQELVTVHPEELPLIMELFAARLTELYILHTRSQKRALSEDESRAIEQLFDEMFDKDLRKPMANTPRLSDECPACRGRPHDVTFCPTICDPAFIQGMSKLLYTRNYDIHPYYVRLQPWYSMQYTWYYLSSAEGAAVNARNVRHHPEFANDTMELSSDLCLERYAAVCQEITENCATIVDELATSDVATLVRSLNKLKGMRTHLIQLTRANATKQLCATVLVF
ncbi:hypothetical protein DL89DRAFT_293152 [Linderina pennispora]|uniref:Chromo domain-containing protein n=1 Tax=Linderina pennispora TaxID=61395 RepID=A0A1Y1W7U1_9FUNG|nr:uncharacterized protein DL89DRAFT_293152 [Linderina pennispora]ORX69512.1 hypothetical protein DL89DRAFT_293152 [Linderina pennispora]